MRIVIAMSGGVDSSVAAARLVDEGHDVIGITLHLWDDPNPAAQSRCCAPEDIRDARRVADHLRFPHYVLDRRETFSRKIVDPFVDAYLAGYTPSPCAVCNQHIKIPALLRAAQLMGADAIATGHYARIVHRESGPRIARGIDRHKDQSYFLFALDSPTLSRLRLPLGRDTKEQVRREASARGLAGAHKGESQDLCFVQDGGYARFVQERAPERIRRGWIIDPRGRKLAAHDGIHNFTLGQRKGLGVALGRPVFVVRIEGATGNVVVDDEDASRVRVVTVDSPVIAAGVGMPTRAWVQVRYRDAGAEAELNLRPDGSLEILFERPVRAASPGQFAVAYVDDEVVAGGRIASVGRDPESGPVDCTEAVRGGKIV
jgi:tRNA-specific 2-thiouridylase